MSLSLASRQNHTWDYRGNLVDTFPPMWADPSKRMTEWSAVHHDSRGGHFVACNMKGDLVWTPCHRRLIAADEATKQELIVVLRMVRPLTLSDALEQSRLTLSVHSLSPSSNSASRMAELLFVTIVRLNPCADIVLVLTWPSCRAPMANAVYGSSIFGPSRACPTFVPILPSQSAPFLTLTLSQV